MKFFVRISVLLTLTLLLTACSHSEKVDVKTPLPSSTPVPDSISSTSGTSASATSVSTPVQPNEGFKYELTTETYFDNGIQIKYPKLTGLKDSVKQTQLNDLIQKHALFARDLYKNSDKPAHVDINCEVKLQSDKILSIVYSGLGYVETAAHPNRLFYTTNLDLKTGNLLRLQDAVKIDADFVKLFRQGTYVSHEQKENEELKKSVLQWISRKTDVELVNLFTSSDFAEEYDPKYPPEVFSYYTKDGLGISIPVPHPIGDQAEFDVKVALKQ